MPGTQIGPQQLTQQASKQPADCHYHRTQALPIHSWAAHDMLMFVIDVFNIERTLGRYSVNAEGPKPHNGAPALAVLVHQQRRQIAVRVVGDAVCGLHTEELHMLVLIRQLAQAVHQHSAAHHPASIDARLVSTKKMGWSAAATPPASCYEWYGLSVFQGVRTFPG